MSLRPIDCQFPGHLLPFQVSKILNIRSSSLCVFPHSIRTRIWELVESEKSYPSPSCSETLGWVGGTAKHTLKSTLHWSMWSWWHLGRFRHQPLCNPLYPILYTIYEIVLYIVSSTNLPHRLPGMVAQSYIPGTHTLGKKVDLVFKATLRDMLRCKWCLSTEEEITVSLLSKENRCFLSPICKSSV